MRRTLVVTAVAAVFLMTLAAPAALASGAPVLGTASFSFNDLNPCTGERHRVTFDWTIRVHDFVTDDGLHHLTIHESFTITTSSGWVGSGERQTMELTSEDGDETVMFVAHDQLHNPDFPGQTFLPSTVIHVKVKDGEVATDIGRFRFECVGNV